VSPRKLMRAHSALARKGERERGKRRVENKQSICMDIYVGKVERDEPLTTIYHSDTTVYIPIIYLLYIYIYISPLQPTHKPPLPQILYCSVFPTLSSGPSRISNS